jgi:hypothetical protein
MRGAGERTDAGCVLLILSAVFVVAAAHLAHWLARTLLLGAVAGLVVAVARDAWRDRRRRS